MRDCQTARTAKYCSTRRLVKGETVRLLERRSTSVLGGWSTGMSKCFRVGVLGCRSVSGCQNIVDVRVLDYISVWGYQSLGKHSLGAIRCRSIGRQSAGMSEFWYIGFLGCRSTGMMGYWPGMMGYWDVEVLG